MSRHGGRLLVFGYVVHHHVLSVRVVPPQDYQPGHIALRGFPEDSEPDSNHHNCYRYGKQQPSPSWHRGHNRVVSTPGGRALVMGSLSRTGLSNRYGLLCKTANDLVCQQTFTRPSTAFTLVSFTTT
jgi:hypothetical protein